MGDPDVPKELTALQQAHIRHAMQSVYYYSLGRQWQLRGAPAVLLPPDVRPMGLADALTTLKELSLPRWRDAIWRIIRSVPLRSGDVPVERRFPHELIDEVGRDWLAALDGTRRHYRAGANLFAAALDALADDSWGVTLQLLEILKGETGRKAGIDEAVQNIFGINVEGFLYHMQSQRGESKIVGNLRKLEDQVGLNTHDLVMDFADTAALRKQWNENASLAKPQAGVALTVYPVSTAVTQNSTTLTTTATATTIVKGPRDVLARAIDPQSWKIGSTVIDDTRYVEDMFTLRALPDPPTVGMADGVRRLVHEKASISWGSADDRQGLFNVVLNTRFTVEEEKMQVTFSLARSVDSRILWDRRFGGILLDGGFVTAWQLTDDSWRVTSRKVLRFSDRTPLLNGSGWSDVGQMLNYLTPAALAWWLESEIYKFESPQYT